MQVVEGIDGWTRIDGPITRADPDGEGWEIEIEGMWGTYWLRPEFAKDLVPKVGDPATVWTENFSLCRGLEIAGRLLFYTTREEAEKQKLAAIAENDSRHQAELDRDREDRDRRRAALPDVLQQRLNRYEAANPNWRRDYEGYELFTVEQAASLAAVEKKGDLHKWYERFRGLSDAKMKELWPELSDAHSGNTFGYATQIAYWMNRGWDDYVIGGHGAFVPLVGCAKYGCHQE